MLSLIRYQFVLCIGTIFPCLYISRIAIVNLCEYPVFGVIWLIGSVLDLDTTQRNPLVQES
jgi:hypothetical protein